MFNSLGQFGNMLRQAQQLSGKMESINAELRGKRATGTAGGGMVEVDMNGLQEVLACRIDPALIERKDRELIEELTRAAVNDALARSRTLHAEAIQGLAGNFEIPGLEEALGKLGGGGSRPSS